MSDFGCQVRYEWGTTEDALAAIGQWASGRDFGSQIPAGAALVGLGDFSERQPLLPRPLDLLGEDVGEAGGLLVLRTKKRRDEGDLPSPSSRLYSTITPPQERLARSPVLLYRIDLVDFPTDLPLC